MLHCRLCAKLLKGKLKGLNKSIVLGVATEDQIYLTNISKITPIDDNSHIRAAQIFDA